MSCKFSASELDCVRGARQLHPDLPQRELAHLIYDNFGSDIGRAVAHRTFFSVYGALRRLDKTAAQTTSPKA
jgi:hypothetical protein